MISLDYIAGIFDGEGWFMMRRMAGAKGITVRPWRYQCYAHIVMRDAWLLEQIKDRLGYGWATPFKAETERNAAYFQYGATGINLQRFCDEIGPRLHLKRPQAALVSEVCEIKRRIGNQPVGDADYARQSEIWEQLRALNQKGPERNRSADAMRDLARSVVPVAMSAWAASFAPATETSVA